ncbi:MAG TPA: plastocyanin/azurin family copper-binding protein [Piscinibacter sp.]|nr:plastocyanin/azurin family copper-binding protein [Ilumatobacteraceae bacterium]HNK17212.1 plastocyanin/azurin family copper-binding protein [Piscinibacter sp.]
MSPIDIPFDLETAKMLRPRAYLSITAALLTVTAVFTTACGSEPGDGASAPASPGATAADVIEVGKPVQIHMHDIGFDKQAFTVAAGTEVEFDFTNDGKIPHDAFIGDHEAQLEHDAEMAAMATATTMAGMDGMDMPGHGAGEPAITVQPGAQGTLTYTFDAPGTYEIGCHQPGHYAAGMTITVIVT